MSVVEWLGLGIGASMSLVFVCLLLHWGWRKLLEHCFREYRWWKEKQPLEPGEYQIIHLSIDEEQTIWLDIRYGDNAERGISCRPGDTLEQTLGNIRLAVKKLAEVKNPANHHWAWISLEGCTFDSIPLHERPAKPTPPSAA